MHTHRVKRCKLNVLDQNEREKIGFNEIAAARDLWGRQEISLDEYMKRRADVIPFMMSSTNSIISDGVVIEFYVEEEEP